MLSLAGYTRPTLHTRDADPRTTLQWMVRLTQAGLSDVSIRLLAEEIVKDLWPHDYLSEYAAVLNWVRTHVRYTRDPIIIEQVKTPRAIIETGTGDCDDMCVIIGTLVGTLGGKARYVAGGFRRHMGGEPALSHVWCEAFDPASKKWVVLDPVPGRNVGEMLRRLVDTVAVPAV